MLLNGKIDEKRMVTVYLGGGVSEPLKGFKESKKAKEQKSARQANSESVRGAIISIEDSLQSKHESLKKLKDAVDSAGNEEEKRGVYLQVNDYNSRVLGVAWALREVASSLNFLFDDQEFKSKYYLYLR